MINTVIRSKPLEEKTISFPCLRQARATADVVAFTHPTRGVVVVKGARSLNKQFEFSDQWLDASDERYWEDFHGFIELSNQQ